MISELARENRKYIIAGSIPEFIEEEQGKRVYNTCLCFNRDGEIVAKHRKLHLFDINIPGGVYNMESDIVKHGPP
jgi:omega-amidase